MKLNTIIILALIGFYGCKEKPALTNKFKDTQAEQKSNIEVEKHKIDVSNYVFNTIDNKQTTINLNKDTLYILDFWYLECVPCIKDHKVIAKYIDSLKTTNIEVLGMSIDRSKQKWADYLNNHDYNWLNYNQYNMENMLYEDLEIRLFPKYVIIKNSEIIIGKFNRFEKVLNHLKSEM